ncbi:hypothetical protein ACWD3Z_45870, partial [Streptomyces sp. NPDC002740]
MLQTDASGAVHQALTEAYDRGQQAAIAELGALGVGQAAAAVLDARRTTGIWPKIDPLFCGGQR